MPADLALLFHDARGARHAVNALAGAVEASPLGARVEVGFEADPAALGRACARARAEGRQALVAWSFLSAGFGGSAAALAAAKAHGGGGALHLAGGVHATAEPDEVLVAGFDLAAVGEGEATLLLLLERLLGGGRREGPGLAWREEGLLARGPRPPVVDLDAVPPFPPSLSRGGPIELTRGCVHACRFCQTSFAAGARPRHRSAEAVARWAGAAVRSGRPDVRFVTPSALAYGSEDGSARLDRVEALLLAVRAAAGPGARVFLGTFPSEVRPEHVTPEALRLLRRLVDNRALLIGAQSGSERMLARSHRGHGVEEVERAVALAREAGFAPEVDFILGLPGEEEADREATRRLMARLAERGARVHGHTFMPLPGTPWARERPGAPDPASRRLLEVLSSRGQAFGQWRAQGGGGDEG